MTALAALLIALVGIAALAVAGLSGSPHRAASTANRPTNHATTPAPTPTVRHRTKPKAHPKPAPATSTQAASTAPPSPEQLQLTGHEEMLAGNYQTAIATLRQAVQAAAPGSLTYAYGLYDLGRSMVLAGDPGGAVPVLEARLKIPDQTAVVQQELKQALQASGQVPAQMTPTQAASPGRSGEHRKHKGTEKGGPPAHDQNAAGAPSGGAALGGPAAHQSGVTATPSLIVWTPSD